MTPRTSSLWAPAQIRAIDAFASHELGISGPELMRRAAQGALLAMRRRWPEATDIGVLCGAGNNGGDGYVLARLAHEAGLAVRVAALTPPAKLQGDARLAHDEWLAAGGALTEWRELTASPPRLWVDALLGIGATRALEGDFAAAAVAMNASGVPIVALDVPSGLDASSGKRLGTHAVRAALTVTFIGDKPGLWLGEGPDVAGEVIVNDLAVARWPDDLGEPVLEAVRAEDVARALPPRARGANKGNFGHVLVIAGQTGMPGAALLSAEAALRCGAGLVSVATAPDHAATLSAARPELMIHGVRSPSDARGLIERASVIAIGPGLGQEAWGKALWDAALAAGKPLVVDADALNLLAKAHMRRDDWVLTPHPGEAARLLGSTSAAVQADRIAAVDRLQQTFGGTVVLKGAGTLIAGAAGPATGAGIITRAICTRGNPGMAAPGMGDALTGVIAALHAQLKDAALAARISVFVHASAGDAAAASEGQRGLIASDLIARLRECVNPR